MKKKYRRAPHVLFQGLGVGRRIGRTHLLQGLNICTSAIKAGQVRTRTHLFQGLNICTIAIKAGKVRDKRIPGQSIERIDRANDRRQIC